LYERLVCSALVSFLLNAKVGLTAASSRFRKDKSRENPKCESPEIDCHVLLDPNYDIDSTTSSGSAIPLRPCLVHQPWHIRRSELFRITVLVATGEAMVRGWLGVLSPI